MQKFLTFLTRNRVVIAILVLAFAGAVIPSKFDVTLSPSLRYRVFFLDKAPDKTIRRGEYLLLELSSKYIMDGKPFKATKQAACVEGDTLRVVGREYYCNDEYLGRAKDYSLKGEKLENFVYNGVIPEGRIFLFGQHRDSFDSRYFGFVMKEKIEAIAYPVF